MNILIFSWRGPGHPNAGGAEISTHEHAKGWVKAGHSVTLFTAYYNSAKKEEIVDGVTVIRRGSQFFGVQWEAFKWYCFNRHSKFDLVVDQFHGIPFFTPLYVKAKKLAFIHEVTREVWGLNPLRQPFNLIPKVLGSVFEPLIFQLFYKNIPFMTVSQSTKEDLIKWGIHPKNITVIHNGINIFRMSISEKQALKTIIFLGALAKDKGIEDAIKVFSILQKSGKEKFQYWVVGKTDGRYLKLLKQQAQDLDLADIKFWGYVSEKEKFELLAKSHILLNPSIREGWGLVIIEAARMGTPAVAYNVAGLKDSVVDQKTGLLSGCSPADMAVKVADLLSDDVGYKTMCKNAVIWSRNFSWEKSGKMSLNLLEKITS